MPTWAIVLIYIWSYLFLLIFSAGLSFLAIKKCRQGKQSGIWIGLIATIFVLPLLGVIPFWISYNKNSKNKTKPVSNNKQESNLLVINLKRIELEEKLEAINKNLKNKTLVDKFYKEIAILEKEIEDLLKA
ncbi:hypothetical protein CK556_02390 [Mesoplasma chauliocola]|uniref:Uncharacterized protein n=1 Tax=Mesoplasma chauliocola TaxID=216427 RepID=A0A249SNL7_9MOLU|nr:hypothetical protein [Mesoplasma chauliocola]ASZ09193.1 hypothetical protein CK556_02390 [Mesoplasma chauliocola]